MKGFFGISLSHPDNYPYWQSFSVGMASAFCTFLVDTLTVKQELFSAPVIAFAASTYVALYYFLPTDRDDGMVSFKNYKINYNHSLGEGCFGEVYTLVPRPENERGYLSDMLPYFYDYYFPVNNNYQQDDGKYCVKIQKNIWFATHERLEERETNRVLRKNGVTKIKFYSSNCHFSQIKTRVHGKTFGWHLANNSFLNPENHIMRENFVLFYRSLSYSSMVFDDINTENIMYDEQKKRWEIIDGFVCDKDDPNESIAYKFFAQHRHDTLFKGVRSPCKDNFDSAVSYWFQKSGNKFRDNMLILLRETALSGEEYTKQKDSEILDICRANEFLDGAREPKNSLDRYSM